MANKDDDRSSKTPDAQTPKSDRSKDLPEITRDLPLGTYLMLLRKAHGLSLRQVEEATDKEVSNAYLSQLENNKISKPSPNILHVLANQYGVDYEDLLMRAGYLPTKAESAGRRQGRVAAFAIQNLTPDEEKALLAYLEFIRQQNRK